MKVNYTPEQVAELFDGNTERWWIAGGWAIDLFLGKQTREHEDVDVAILHEDERSFRTHLQSWEIWPGLGNNRLEDKPVALEEDIASNCGVLWCRPLCTSEWAFELLFNKTDGEEWVFKRDDSIRKPIEDISGISSAGIPYLNPEIVLLHKAKNLFSKDKHDFEQVLPRLGAEARAWFGDSLRVIHPGHPWLDVL